MWFPADATKHPLPQAANARPITPTIIILHTNGGFGTVDSLWSYWNSISSGVFSHFQVDVDGAAAQYQSTDLEAPAQWAGNAHGVSIETQDGNDPTLPWSAEQLHAIGNIIRAVAQYHNIPLRLVQSPTDTGIGYHQQFPEWNQSGHNCPGPVRVAQLVNTLIPSLTEVSELTPDDWKTMGALADKIITHTRNDMLALLKGVNAKVDTIKADVEALKQGTPPAGFGN